MSLDLAEGAGTAEYSESELNAFMFAKNKFGMLNSTLTGKSKNKWMSVISAMVKACMKLGIHTKDSKKQSSEIS